MSVAVFAGGCFWCTEAVFKRLKGVSIVKPGFTGGHIKNPAYREVVTERTGHAEAVYIEFDASEISYLKLLEVFFATHDPTTLNRQGADKGTHYRSAIFTTNENQKQKAINFVKVLEQEKLFNDPIVTQICDFEVFYDAEDYHFNYYDQNTEQPYCNYVISPKIQKLENYFSDILE